MAPGREYPPWISGGNDAGCYRRYQSDEPGSDLGDVNRCGGKGFRGENQETANVGPGRGGERRFAGDGILPRSV